MTAFRTRAFRRKNAITKYLRRVNQEFKINGGYIVDNLTVKRCESAKDFLERVNPYILKRQGNFKHHSDKLEKFERMKQIKKYRRCRHLLID